VAAKRPSASKVARPHKSPVAREETEVARLSRERDEALEQQKATAEVLRVISASPSNLEPVFQAVLENATRLCAAKFGEIFRFDGAAFCFAARVNTPPDYAEFQRRRGSFQPYPGGGLDRMMRTKRVTQVADNAAEAVPTPAARLGGARSTLWVPMLKDDALIGAITIYRQEVRPFTDKQIELVTNFAAQAVIAIENARLLSELRESLEQQVATAEVLSIINSSLGDLKPVFETMLKNAVRLCEAKFGFMARYDGNAFHVMAHVGAAPAYVKFVQRGPLRTGPETILGQVLSRKQAVQIPDLAATRGYAERNPLMVAAVELGGVRTYLAVPMFKGNKIIGAVLLYRQQVQPFSDNQVALLTSFAAQAVIAIENTRLFNELRESLQQETATAEVLKVISTSPGELEPVFNSILDNAVRICGARFGNLALYDGVEVRLAAMHNAPHEFEKLRRENPAVPLDVSPLGAVVRTKQRLHILDLTTEEPYNKSMLVNVAGARSMLAVPMLKENVLIGVVNIYRQEVKPFTEKQITLLENFAAQAVIAIENTRLLNELQESLEQQTSTSEVLKIVASSNGELTPVFEAILANATRLCDASNGNMFLCENDDFRTAAFYGPRPPAFIEQYRIGTLFRPGVELPALRAVKTRQPVHVTDLATTRAYLDGDPLAVAGVDVAGIRTLLAVPMLREAEPLGVITIFRKTVRAFTDKQIALVQNFAAQAVIAIENARLLSELRESLAQQTATSEVLGVISSSPGELQPVFNTMLENGVRICGAKYGVMYRYENGTFQPVANYDVPNEVADYLAKRGRFEPHTGSPLAEIIQTKRPVNIADITQQPGTAPRAATIGGAHSFLCVPMLKENALVGAIIIYRQEISPFTQKQIALVQNFAAQAVIAIENARLLSDLRQRTGDLTESLEQQTATSEVLEVISSSAGELEPVFQAMLRNATRLCDAKFGSMYVREGEESLRIVALHGAPAAFAEERRHNPVVRPGPLSGLGHIIRTKQILEVSDLSKTKGYLERDPLRVAQVELAGARTYLAVPMLKEGELVGAITIYRQEVRPFTKKQVELIQSFAAQAVIAIENTRLLSELRESLSQQTATADVLKVISRSTFDLQTVLDTLVESAAKLCEADSAAIHRPVGDAYPYAASYGFSQAYKDFMNVHPIKPGRGSVLGRAVLGGEIAHVIDVEQDPDYALTEAQKIGGWHTVLGVPLMREGTPIGVIMLTRNQVRPFTDKQIALVTTFADQAAIAIENVRLFEDVQTRTRELAKSLEELRAAQDRLVQTEKLASLGQLTAGIAHEIKNPLNFVNNFSGVSVELIDELQDTLQKVKVDDKTRAEIVELTETLKGNLDKVVQHGKRADSIVKNMLLHSRQGSSEHRVVDINGLVEESLNLAYHGARAEKQGFNITLERSLDPAAGQADLIPQDITRVLLNIIANGFYAATKRKAEGNGRDYEPTLSATTKNLGDRVEIRIRDNGTGIPPEVKEKMFSPFFTTKPAGEGTGLGLSISHDIIVKQHFGHIEVDSKPGSFTEFRIVLPRQAAFPAKPGVPT